MRKHLHYSAMKCAIIMLAIVGITMNARAQTYEAHDINYSSGTGPDLQAHQANLQGYEWTVRNGTAAVDLTGNAPFMYWFQDPLSAGIVTAQITVVSATAGVFRALFEPSDLNPSFMTNLASGATNLRYGVGLTFSGGPSVARQGRFRLLSDPFSAGGVGQTFATTNVNWTLINWIGLPAFITDAESNSNIYARVNGGWTNISALLAGISPDLSTLSNDLSAVTAAAITNESDTLLSVLTRGNNAGTAGITNIQFLGYYLALDQYIDFEDSIIGGTTPWLFTVQPSIPGYLTTTGSYNLALGTNAPPAWTDSTNRVSSIVLNGVTTTPVNGRADLGTIAGGSAAQSITTNAWGQIGWTNSVTGEFAPLDGLWPTYTPTLVQNYGAGATITTANIGSWVVGQSNGFAYAQWSALENVNQARILDSLELPDSNVAFRAAIQIVEPPMGDGAGRYIFGLGFARSAITSGIYALCFQKNNESSIPWSTKWVTFTNAASAQGVFAGSVYSTAAQAGTLDVNLQNRWRPERGNWLLIDKPAASALFRFGLGRGNDNRITPFPYMIGASTNIPNVASHVVVVGSSFLNSSVTNALQFAWRNLMLETNALWWP